MSAIYMNVAPANNEYAGKTFYGFKLDANGDLNVEAINDGTLITLPDPDNQSGPADYRHYIWTEDTLREMGLLSKKLPGKFKKPLKPLQPYRKKSKK